MAESSAGSDELISQFMAFSGSTDATKAASYLEMCGNDVETAVSLYMEHEQGGGGGGDGLYGGNDLSGSDYGGAASGVTRGRRGGGGGGADGDDVRAPDETRTMRLMDDDHAALGGGMFRGGDPAYHLMSAMMDMEEQMTQSAFAAAPPQLSSRAILDAAIAAQAQGVDVSQEAKQNDEEDDDDFEVLSRPPEVASLSDIFAPPNHIIHRAGGFQGARTMARDTKRWLLVNIQRDSEFASHALNRDVWRDELVENLIREGFIFWQQVRIFWLGCLLSTDSILTELSNRFTTDGWNRRRKNVYRALSSA
jgi:UBX domain-containing protein 7